MLTALCALALFVRPNLQEVTVEPTDDVWVYQFAEDQVGDQYLRVWGSDGVAVGTSFEGHLSFSFSCLKFQLPLFPAGTKFKSAKLVLTHTPEPGWTEKDSKANPVQARILGTDWDEKKWAYDDAKKVHPSADKDTIFGTGAGKPASDDKPFTIEVNLSENKDVFEAAFSKASNMPTRSLAIALTSSLQPGDAGENTVYKFYSKANEANLRPKLVLTFE